MSPNKLNKGSKLGLPLSLLNFTLFLLFNLFPPLFFLNLLLFQCNTQLLVLFLRKKKILQNKTIEERWAFSWKAKSWFSNVLFGNFKSTHLKSWGSRLGSLWNHHYCTGKRMRCKGGSRGRVQGVRPPPSGDDLRFSNTTGILPKKKTMWFIGVEVVQQTSAPPPKKKSWIRPWEERELQPSF